jgi:hypothetical protein
MSKTMKSKELSFDDIVEAQRKYVTKRFGRKVAKASEYGIGSDGELSYVESLVVINGVAKHLLTSFVTDSKGKTSNKHFTGRPNSLKHVINL